MRETVQVKAKNKIEIHVWVTFFWFFFRGSLWWLCCDISSHPPFPLFSCTLTLLFFFSPSYFLSLSLTLPSPPFFPLLLPSFPSPSSLPIFYLLLHSPLPPNPLLIYTSFAAFGGRRAGLTATNVLQGEKGDRGKRGKRGRPGPQGPPGAVGDLGLPGWPVSESPCPGVL